MEWMIVYVCLDLGGVSRMRRWLFLAVMGTLLLTSKHLRIIQVASMHPTWTYSS